MPVVNLEPTKDHPVPYDLSEEKASTPVEEVAVAGNTVELQVSLGASLEVSEENAEREQALIRAVTERKKVSNLSHPPTAFAAASFLRMYGQQLAMDASEARGAITNKLMELANCGDPRYELKALELLGKHSDIGIFTERSELTINYKNPEDLEKAIKDRVKNLLNATVVDVAPMDQRLDDTLGEEGEEEELDV